MNTLEISAGQKIGRWTVIKKGPTTRFKCGYPKKVWVCQCDCGTKRNVDHHSLVYGKSQGCTQCRPLKHGMSHMREYKLWMVARCRARKAGLVFTITLSDIVIPAKCPLLGIPIRFGNSRFNDHNPSIDQIKAGQGYTKKNTWIVSWRANVIKHNATLAELEMLATNLKAKLASCSTGTPRNKPEASL